MARKRFIPSTILLLLGLVLFGNLGFNYIVSLMAGMVEFQPLYLAGSILLFGVTILLSLRIVYQIDRRGGRLKRRIKWFEPMEER